jgi:hypothetical protein
MPAGDRIAVFTERSLFGLACGGRDETTFTSAELRDFPRSTGEVLRLMRDRTCSFCGAAMRTIYVNTEVGELMLCPICGYWGGRGTRELGHGALNARGVLGVVGLHRHSASRCIDAHKWDESGSPDLNSPMLSFDQVLGQLQALPSRLLTLSPHRAEAIVADLLADVLDCEVRRIGGVRDGGVDGYIVVGGEIKSIVQVKWHRNSRRAESVRLVREIAGTLLARGIPRGLLVTTSERLSPDAEREIETLRSREVNNCGRIAIDAATYSDLLDMLELAWARRGGDFEAATPWFWMEEPGDSHGWIWDYLRM